MRNFLWSTVPSATEPKANRCSGDLDRFFSFCDQTFGRAKDGEAFCAGWFDGDHRKKSNMSEVDFLMLDFDEARGKVADIVAPLMPYAFFAYSTWSHGIDGKWSPDQPRFRVILPLARAITVDEYAILWEMVSDLVGNSADRAASDASRLMYLPRETAPGAKVKAWRKANRADDLLDPDAYGVADKVRQLAAERTKQAEIARLKREARAADPDSGHWVESALFSIPAEDYEIAMKVCFALKYADEQGELNGDSMWFEWISTSSKHDPKLASKMWKNSLPENGPDSITLGTLWDLAKQNGWSPPPRPDKLDIDKALESWVTARDTPSDAPKVHDTADSASAPIETLVEAVSAPTKREEKPAEPFRSPLFGKNDKYLVETALEELGFRDGRIVHDGSAWVRYDDKRGIFIREKNAIYRHVFRYWDGRPIVPTEANDEPKPFRVSDKNCKTLESAASIMAYVPTPLGAPMPGVAFRNGFLRSDTGELVDHSPAHRATVAYAFDYSDAPVACEQWDMFLRSAFEGVEEEDSKIRLIEEYLGVCLLGRATEFEAVLFLLGEGMNGKSTLIKAAEQAFPEMSTSKVSPHHISSKQSHAMNSIANLDGILLNVVLDLKKDELRDMGDFKAIVSGDPVQGRRMREDPYWFRPRAGHVFATNDLPQVSDSSDGFWRRARAIDFEIKVTEDTADRTLGAKLEAERVGIVHRFILRGREAIERGRLTHCASVQARTDRWRYESVPTRLFLEQEGPSLKLDHKRRIGAAELYRAYRAWSENNGFKPYSSTNFGREVTRLGVRREKSGTVYYYVEEWCDAHLEDRRKTLVEVPF